MHPSSCRRVPKAQSLPLQEHCLSSHLSYLLQASSLWHSQAPFIQDPPRQKQFSGSDLIKSSGVHNVPLLLKAKHIYLHLQSLYALHSGTQLWGLNQGILTVTHFPKLHLQLASCIFLQNQYCWQSLVNLQVFSFEVINSADMERQIKIVICLILQLLTNLLIITNKSY